MASNYPTEVVSQSGDELVIRVFIRPVATVSPHRTRIDPAVSTEGVHPFGQGNVSVSEQDVRVRLARGETLTPSRQVHGRRGRGPRRTTQALIGEELGPAGMGPPEAPPVFPNGWVPRPREEITPDRPVYYGTECCTRWPRENEVAINCVCGHRIHEGCLTSLLRAYRHDGCPVCVDGSTYQQRMDCVTEVRRRHPDMDKAGQERAAALIIRERHTVNDHISSPRPGDYSENDPELESESTIRGRREILSSDKADLKSLIQGPPGVVGPPGPRGDAGAPGKDGRDGRDFTSLKLLEGVINKTVMTEWSKLSQQLPTYSGATYTRWGRASCPSQSKLIYKGQMTGPDYRSPGGGSNYQCLPDDPEYNPKAPSGVPHSKLRTVFYEVQLIPKIFGGALHKHPAPCVVCETNKRTTQLMIPAKVQCPTSEWQLEYQGYLMSSAEQHSDNNYVKGEYYRGSYVCVDVNAESATSKQIGIWSGAPIYPVTVSCSGDGALASCPPYLADGRALSCVVCSK